MDVKVIDAVKSAFRPRSIPFCLINEAALNYYNVPRALNVRILLLTLISLTRR